MTLSNYEILKGQIEGIFSEGSPYHPPAISKTIGFRLTSVSASEAAATMEMETDPAIHGNPMGTVHGGVLCDIADAAIACAHWSRLQEGESYTTMDLKINFFRSVKKEKIKAAARAVHEGKTVSYYICDITREDDGKLVATASSTIMTLRTNK